MNLNNESNETQEKLLEKYNLENYQKEFILKTLPKIPKTAKKILELGSDLELQVAKAIAEITGIEVIATNIIPTFPKEPKKEDGITIVYADGMELQFEDESFDMVISLCTLEHVQNIQKFLQEAKRALKKEGTFFTSFAPIWSSPRGHHVWTTFQGKTITFHDKNCPVPKHGHLLMNKEEMKKYLTPTCGEELAKKLTQNIYHDPGRNRKFFEEYKQAMEDLNEELEITLTLEPANPETKQKLEQKYGKKDFTTKKIEMSFKKS